MFVETLAQTPSRLGFALLAVLGLLLVVVILVRDPGARSLAHSEAGRPILSGPHRRRGLRRRGVLCAGLIGMVGALWWTGLAPSQPVGAIPPDPALARLPLPPPVARSQGAVVTAEALTERSQAVLALRRAFFAGDIEVLESGLDEARREHLDQARAEGVTSALLEGLGASRLAIVDPCEDWLRRRPDSYAAHWVCGALRAAAAMDGRAAAHRARATALLERALELDPRPLEAHVALVGSRIADGEHTLAMAHLERAEALLPTYLPIHQLRLQHGGNPGEAVARARAAGIGGSALLDLEDVLTRPLATSAPGALRAYWENAVRQHPTRTRFDQLLGELSRAGNWHAARPVAAAMAGAYPNDAAAQYWQAMIHERLGLLPEALEAYRRAAALAHEAALQHLIRVHARGGSGVPGGSPDQVLELCWYGAALGSAVGANCIGAAYLMDDRRGLDLPQDRVRGLAWHRRAALAGHAGSQFALGRALYEGELAGMDAAEARSVGVYWLRRAAAQDHAMARRILEQAGEYDGRHDWRAQLARVEPLRALRAAFDSLLAGLRPAQ